MYAEVEQEGGGRLGGRVGSRQDIRTDATGWDWGSVKLIITIILFVLLY